MTGRGARGLLLGFLLLLLSVGIPALTGFLARHWFAVSPLFVAWIIALWGAVGPLWGATALVLTGLVMTDAALGARQPWLIGAVWGFLAGTGAAVLSSHRALQGQERLRQAAAEAAEERANTLRKTVSQLETTDRAIQARLQRYTALRGITAALDLHVGDAEALLKGVAQQILLVLDHADLALVYLVEAPRYELTLRAVHWRRPGPRTIKWKMGDLFDQWVLRQGQPLLVQNVRKDFRFPREAAARDDRPVASLIAVPMISAQRVLGVLRAESAAPEAFTPEDLRLLDIVADLAAMAVENLRLYARTAELAITDDLTGLAVHRYFHERFEEELARARRHNSPVSILLIDIDHFKAYNDTYGHSAGDKLLRTLAQLLRHQEGAAALLARYGGEEFAMLLSGVTHAGAAQQAEAIRRAVESQVIDLRQGKARVTVSIGVATFPGDGLHRESVLQVADQRLYRAKDAGRNQVCAA